MTQHRTSRPRLVLAVVVSISVLLPAIVVGLVMAFHHPYQGGEPLALLHIESGVPFELAFVSNGDPQRVWLDLDCDACSLPVEGTLTTFVDGKVLERVEISAGEDYAGPHERLSEQLLTSIPAASAGAQVTISGTLTISAERGVFDERPRTDAAPPAVHTFRVTLAP